MLAAIMRHTSRGLSAAISASTVDGGSGPGARSSGELPNASIIAPARVRAARPLCRASAAARSLHALHVTRSGALPRGRRQAPCAAVCRVPGPLEAGRRFPPPAPPQGTSGPCRAPWPRPGQAGHRPGGGTPRPYPSSCMRPGPSVLWGAPSRPRMKSVLSAARQSHARRHSGALRSAGGRGGAVHGASRADDIPAGPRGPNATRPAPATSLMPWQAGWRAVGGAEARAWRIRVAPPSAGSLRQDCTVPGRRRRGEEGDSGAA